MSAATAVARQQRCPQTLAVQSSCVLALPQVSSPLTLLHRRAWGGSQPRIVPCSVLALLREGTPVPPRPAPAPPQPAPAPALPASLVLVPQADGTLMAVAQQQATG